MVPVGAHQGESITCYLATTKPTIDGKWTAPNEWNDTAQVELIAYTGSGTAYLRVKYDQEYLYALVDFVSDSTINGFSLIMIDGDHDGGAAPDVYGGPEPDDYGFIQGFSQGNYKVYVFLNPLSSSKFLMKASTNAVNDPYSTSAHLIYEFRVLRSVLGSSSTIGFYARAVDSEGGVDVAWPSAPKTSLAMSSKDVEAPDDWGDLEFSAIPIPEFAAGPSLFFFTILVAAVVLFKSENRKTRRAK